MEYSFDAGIVGRFNTKWLPEPNTGCWLWIGSRTPRGYGKLYIGTNKTGAIETVYAHRFSYELHGHCRVLPAMMVCHRCDVPECVNPDHLFLGDGRANMQDARNKGRLRGLLTSAGSKGINNIKAKLREVDIIDIRNRCSMNESDAQVAERYGVTANLIGMIRRRRLWTHL